MKIRVAEVPDLTGWTKERLEEIERFNTIGDFLAEQNPVSKLRQIRGVGKQRANRIIQLITGYVDEYLS